MPKYLGDRVRGALVGLALGDALGAPVEGGRPENTGARRQELFQLRGGGSVGWAPGEFTNDTQMALVLARHLAARDGRLDQDELAWDWARWFDGAKGVCGQTAQVLRDVAITGNWRQAAAELHARLESNGCVLRVAPVALAAYSRRNAVDLARAQAEITHPSPICLEAAGVYAWLLRDVLETGGLDLDGALREVTMEPVRSAIERSREGTTPRMSAWVPDVLTGALWAVYGAQSFEDALWRAVCLGPVGAAAGALAGAKWGLRAIPEILSHRLTSRHPEFVHSSYPRDLIDLADALWSARRHQECSPASQCSSGPTLHTGQ